MPINMGRIRTDAIKKVSFELIKKQGEKFTPDFEANKKAISEMKLFKSKRVRNKVAGYVARIAKRKKE